MHFQEMDFQNLKFIVYCTLGLILQMPQKAHMTTAKFKITASKFFGQSELKLDMR